MARKAQLKTTYLKTKIVLTYRGRKVHVEPAGPRSWENVEAFKQGWHRSLLFVTQQDSHVWAYLSHTLKFINAEKVA